MVREHIRRQRYRLAVRYALDKGWQRPVEGMYQRRYSHDVYGTVLREEPGQWRWMVYIDGGPEIASGISFSPTSIDGRRMANEAWYAYQRRLGVAEWPPPEPLGVPPYRRP